MTVRFRFIAILGAVAVASFVSATAFAEPIEEVEKKLVDAHSKLRSYTARLKDVEDFPLTAGDYMKSDTDGIVEWMRKGDTILYRMEIKGTSAQKFGATESKAEQTSTFVSDGEMFYTLGEQLGQKRFIKQNRDSSINGDFRTMLETVRRDNDVKLVADDKVDDAECFVVEITPKAKPADADPIHKTLAWFRKDIGLCVKVASYNKDGKEVFSHILLGMKVDVPIDVGRFVLKAPDGVEVTDLTTLDEKPTTTSPPKP